MNVRFDRFSVPKSPFQGFDLLGLVAEEQPWVSAINPGAVERYRDYRHAVKNVARISLNETVRAYVVREAQTKSAIGIATIIRNQSVVHPEEGKFSGYDLDYWLHRPASKETHAEVGRKLIDSARDLAERYRPELWNQGDLMIVTAPTDAVDHNYGLTNQVIDFVPTGKPAQLQPGEAQDPYDIARLGQISQLYVGSLTG